MIEDNTRWVQTQTRTPSHCDLMNSNMEQPLWRSCLVTADCHVTRQTVRSHTCVCMATMNSYFHYRLISLLFCRLGLWTVKKIKFKKKNPIWHLMIAYSVQPTPQNPIIFNLHQYKTEKSSWFIHLRWLEILCIRDRLINQFGPINLHNTINFSAGIYNFVGK